MLVIPRNYSCFEYSVVFNIPSDNATNATLATYELKTNFDIEFLLASFFLFLILSMLIGAGFKIHGFYAKRRKEERTHISQ